MVKVLRTRLHHLEALPLIGRVRAAALRRAGIGSIEELVAAGLSGIPKILRAVPEITEEEARLQILPAAWFALLRIPAATSEALIGEGIHDYDSLAATSPAELHHALAGLPEPPTEEQCAGWRDAAATARTQFQVLLRFWDSGQVDPNARISVCVPSPAGDGVATNVLADQEGWILSPPLARGVKYTVGVESNGKYHSLVTFGATTNPLQAQEIDLTGRWTPPARDDIDQDPGWVGPTTEPTLWAVSTPDDLATAGFVILKRGDGDSPSELTTAVHERACGLVIDFVADTRNSALPSDAQDGDVLALVGHGGVEPATADDALRVEHYLNRRGRGREVQ